MHKIHDIHSLSDFQRNTKAHVARLRKTGRPEILTIKGKAEVVVLAAETYQRFLDQLEKMDAIEGIRRGLEEAAQDRGIPIREAILDIRKKHKIPVLRK